MESINADRHVVANFNTYASCLVLGLPMLFSSSFLSPKILEEITFAKLQGPWVLIEHKMDGQDGYAAISKDAKGWEHAWVVFADALLQDVAPRHPGGFYPYFSKGIRIDATHVPVRIQMTTLPLSNHEPFREIGIIRFKGDRLEICVRYRAKAGDPRNPTKDFVSAPNSQVYLYVYRRPNWFGLLQKLATTSPHIWIL